jgi:kelch-like protein 18
MNGLMYAIGGFNGYERLRTVEVFNTDTRKWREVYINYMLGNISEWQVAPLNDKRSALGACVVSDLLYVCGGYDGVTSLATVCVPKRSYCLSMMCRLNATMHVVINGRCVQACDGRDQLLALLYLMERYTVSVQERMRVIHLCSYGRTWWNEHL